MCTVKPNHVFHPGFQEAIMYKCDDGNSKTVDYACVAFLYLTVSFHQQQLELSLIATGCL